jgi:hypothetical protein
MSEKSNNTGQELPVDPATIKLWIANQSLEIQNQKGEQEVRIKEIEATTKLAEQSLGLQRDLLTKQPQEFRKSIITMASIAFAFLLVILSFLAYLIVNGQKEFAYKFCGGIGYIVTTAMGYFFGKRSGKKENSAGTEQGFQEV